MKQVSFDFLFDLYLEWINDYASHETMAEHHGVSPEVMLELIRSARSVYESGHCEA